MRLWHIDLITNSLLPKSQLLAQWRELNSIFKKQDKHILINYIYNYGKEYLWEYTMAVIIEMKKQNIDIKSFINADNYFDGLGEVPPVIYDIWRFKEHNKEYLTICYYNLKEKYIRGQKDFTKDVWEKLDNFYQNEIKGGILWKIWELTEKQ